MAIPASFRGKNLHHLQFDSNAKDKSLHDSDLPFLSVL